MLAVCVNAWTLWLLSAGHSILFVSARSVRFPQIWASWQNIDIFSSKLIIDFCERGSQTVQSCQGHSVWNIVQHCVLCTYTLLSTCTMRKQTHSSLRSPDNNWLVEITISYSVKLIVGTIQNNISSSKTESTEELSYKISLLRQCFRFTDYSLWNTDGWWICRKYFAVMVLIHLSP